MSKDNVIDTLEIRASAIATSIKAMKGMRISSDEHKAMLKRMGQAIIAAGGELEDAVDLMAPFNNLSAFNQELERAGLVRTERSLSALMIAVKGKLG